MPARISVRGRRPETDPYSQFSMGRDPLGEGEWSCDDGLFDAMLARLNGA
jgi:hypothetical protein